MKETIGVICLVLLCGLTTGYFVIRPLVAIGDIPGEIRKLRESIDKLSKIIENRK
jgi:hypothetical protein